MANSIFRFTLFFFIFSPAASKSTQLPGTTYYSSLGAVATVSPHATFHAGQVLKAGGNAVDAAIIAALVLGVVDNYNSGIGGGLFALIHWADGRVQAIDGREMAPAKAHRNMFVRNDKVNKDLSRIGALAIGVPGAVKVLDYLSQQGGVFPISQHYLKAAKVAEDGFPISKEFVKRLEKSQDGLKRFPSTSSIFFDAKGRPWAVGHRLKQLDLANTYQGIAEEGPDYFYRGTFAKALEQWMVLNGGLIDANDMASYVMKIRKPLVSNYYDYHVYGFPPPSSGGVHVAQLLTMFEVLQLDQQELNNRSHMLAESMKLAFADRAFWLGDPDFARVPKALVKRDYIETLVAKVRLNEVIEVKEHGTPKNANQDWFDKHTTHIATADKQGNWVAITSTLNTSFGSKVVIPGTGVLMNNQMDDFSAQPGVPNAYGLVGSEANSIQPGKRPLSSMSPTIVLHREKPVMTIGAAGGPMIITQVVQGISNHLTLNKDLLGALAAPRIHHQWHPSSLFHDRLLPQIQRRSLEAKGHVLKQLRFEGSTNAISIKSGHFEAVSEPRLVERNH